VLIVELTALVLTPARQSAAIDFWTDLGRTSLFLCGSDSPARRSCAHCARGSRT
jgi:hypothetical protein